MYFFFKEQDKELYLCRKFNLIPVQNVDDFSKKQNLMLHYCLNKISIPLKRINNRTSEPNRNSTSVNSTSIVSMLCWYIT